MNNITFCPLNVCSENDCQLTLEQLAKIKASYEAATLGAWWYEDIPALAKTLEVVTKERNYYKARCEVLEIAMKNVDPCEFCVHINASVESVCGDCANDSFDFKHWEFDQKGYTDNKKVENGWIACSERLPDNDGEPVLVFTVEKKVDMPNE